MTQRHDQNICPAKHQARQRRLQQQQLKPWERNSSSPKANRHSDVESVRRRGARHTTLEPGPPPRVDESDRPNATSAAMLCASLLQHGKLWESERSEGKAKETFTRLPKVKSGNTKDPKRLAIDKAAIHQMPIQLPSPARSSPDFTLPIRAACMYYPR